MRAMAEQKPVGGKTMRNQQTLCIADLEIADEFEGVIDCSPRYDDLVAGFLAAEAPTECELQRLESHLVQIALLHEPVVVELLVRGGLCLAQ